MTIDFPTVFLTTGFITEVAGLMLLFSWVQDRRSTSLASSLGLAPHAVAHVQREAERLAQKCS